MAIQSQIIKALEILTDLSPSVLRYACRLHWVEVLSISGWTEELPRFVSWNTRLGRHSFGQSLPVNLSLPLTPAVQRIT